MVKSRTAKSISFTAFRVWVVGIFAASLVAFAAASGSLSVFLAASARAAATLAAVPLWSFSQGEVESSQCW